MANDRKRGKLKSFLVGMIAFDIVITTTGIEAEPQSVLMHVTEISPYSIPFSPPRIGVCHSGCET